LLRALLHERLTVSDTRGDRRDTFEVLGELRAQGGAGRLRLFPA